MNKKRLILFLRNVVRIDVFLVVRCDVCLVDSWKTCPTYQRESV